MPTFEEIYAYHADAYDALVEREDYEGHLLPALAQIAPLAGARVVEMGAGTGRLTRLLAPLVHSIRAFDASAHMLGVAELHLTAIGVNNWELRVADNRRLPVEDAAADIAIAGWTFGHALDWFPDSWRDEIGAAVDEMARVLRRGGTAIILETMTTGSDTPAPPTERLATYYRWLEGERGFSRAIIRTDFRFRSLDEAERLTRFFFGDDLADRVRRENRVTLPENTGIWWRRYEWVQSIAECGLERPPSHEARGMRIPARRRGRSHPRVSQTPTRRRLEPTAIAQTMIAIQSVASSPEPGTNGTPAASMPVPRLLETQRAGSRMQRSAFLIVAAVLVLGCAGGPGGGRGGPLTVTETEVRFSPNRINAKVGQPLVVRIDNDGAQRHDLAFPSIGMPSLKGLETELQPGEATAITLLFDKPGVCTFIGTIPGHFGAGMSGAAYVAQ